MLAKRRVFPECLPIDCVVRVGVLAIARPTFDVTFAEHVADRAFRNLEESDIEVNGTSSLCMTDEAVSAALVALPIDDLDALVVLQATFADSSLLMSASGADLPLVLWAFPEKRSGGRLRLNSFCGINLGGFTLTELGRDYAWLVTAPGDTSAGSQIAHLIDDPVVRPPIGEASSVRNGSEAKPSVSVIVERLRNTTIGRVGERPDGFEPCGYDAEALRSILGVRVDEVPLPELFARSEAASGEAVASVVERSSQLLTGIEDLDQLAVVRSLRMNVGLRSLIQEHHWSGVATRCWPETFTEFGGAACTPMALLAEDGTPGSCEADVYGNITSLVLSWLGGSAAFVADLVDLDTESDTGVLWHCGLAPFEMAEPSATPVATIHSNRRKPLLSEFPLKEGRVTIARFSRSRGVHRLVIGGGQMLREPLAFSGTAGVVRFDSGADTVLRTIMVEGLEHHFGIVYADVVAELHELARELGLPVVEL